MKGIIYSILIVFFISPASAQSLDDSFSIKKMKKDLEIFKAIRIKTNSGLYKYRTVAQIDSSYNWALDEVEKSSTLRDFYNIICQLTDFEGSLHNNTRMPNKAYKLMKKEVSGYFPFSLKLIENKMIVNTKGLEIPLGAEIVSINNIPMKQILPNLYKYYTTDGLNISGKSIGVNYNFSRYYRLHYGLQETFELSYIRHKSNIVEQITFKSTSYAAYYKKVKNRFSRPIDTFYHKDWKENEKYSFQSIDSTTSLLTINSFAMGDESSPVHHRYVAFLDSIFISMKSLNTKNLIVDVRYNGGGTDPNDLVTYSYLTQREFRENKQAWISFEKLPFLKYIYTKVPVFLRPLGVRRYNKEYQEIFTKEKDGKYYQDENSDDHRVRKPNEHAFKGKVYLLISPHTASAASLFAAMAAGNENTTVVGEESIGGYYGHNGHSPLAYILPNSKIETYFSTVNLEQDVPLKANQIHNRGIIPDYNVTQSYADYLNQTDTQMNFVLKLIKDNQD